MMKTVLLPALLLLAACDPAAMADSVNRRAAKSVVVPVVQQYLPAPQAEGVANCVIDNASSAELQSLARDVGTRAGTSTVQTVAGVLRRPEVAQCLTRVGVPQVAGLFPG